MKTKINPWILIPLALLVGLAGGALLFSGEEDSLHDHGTEVAVSTQWTCSMHPQIRQNEPGQCPICGMDLIPVGEASDTADAYTIKLSSSAIRLGNVQTIKAGLTGSPEQTITLNGRIVPDENSIRSQSTHVAGRIERLFVNTAGENVRRGQRIASLYSPELIAAQQELLQAADMSDTQPQLLTAAREKLLSLRLTEGQINSIISTKKIVSTMDIFAEWGGTVLEKRKNVGDHVTEGSVIYVVSDLSKVWVDFDAYESDLPLVNIGDKMNFSISGIPGKTFEGTITFIDPVFDPKTRVARVRVEMANRDGRLKPQMFAKGSITTTNPSADDQLVIPQSAVLWTGRRSIVYVKQAEDEQAGAVFQMQEVVLGPAIGSSYVVESGLAPGSEIVVNGAFTVDAAAQLAGKPSMMNVSEKQASTDLFGVAPADFRKSVGQFITRYTKLKDDLVKSDFEAASAAVNHLKVALESINNEALNESWGTWWAAHREILQTEINSAEEAENIDALRAVFISLSETLVDVGIVVDPLDVPLYIMRCPMANNNEGARWLSLENEVRNPYYGDMMLTCGSVTETIE